MTPYIFDDRCSPEDAAEALGSRHYVKNNSHVHCGLMGDLGVISFNGNKLGLSPYTLLVDMKINGVSGQYFLSLLHTFRRIAFILLLLIFLLNIF